MKNMNIEDRKESAQDEECETLIDFLYKSSFAQKMVKDIAPVILEHTRVILDSKQKIEEIETDNQKKLKGALYLHERIRTVIEDIQKTIGFLRIENKSEITTLFPFLNDDKEYYNYFLENFIIRIASIPDSLAILANHINEYGYSPCYGTTIVKNKKNNVDTQEKIIMQKLLDSSSSIREKRHKKVHEGEVKHDYLDSIVFYNNLFNLIGADFEGKELLIEHDSKLLTESINSIEEETKSIIEIVVEYLNILAPKIDKWIDKKEEMK